MTRKEYNELKNKIKTTPGLTLNESDKMFIVSIIHGGKEMDVKVVRLSDDYSKNLLIVNKIMDKAYYIMSRK